VGPLRVQLLKLRYLIALVSWGPRKGLQLWPVRAACLR
jgi:hypothetical protein